MSAPGYDWRQEAAALQRQEQAKAARTGAGGQPGGMATSVNSVMQRYPAQPAAYQPPANNQYAPQQPAPYTNSQYPSAQPQYSNGADAPLPGMPSANRMQSSASSNSGYPPQQAPQSSYPQQPQSPYQPQQPSAQSHASPYGQPTNSQFGSPNQPYPNQSPYQQGPATNGNAAQSLNAQFGSMSMNNGNQQPSSAYPLPQKPLPYNGQQPSTNQQPPPHNNGFAPQTQQPGYPQQQPYPPQQSAYPSQQPQPQHYGQPQQQAPQFPPPHVIPVHPRYFTTTCASLPNNQQLRQATCIPFGGVLRPLNDDIGSHATALPVVHPDPNPEVGVIRCKDCRTYMNPYVQFFSNGQQWRCNICGLPNIVPQGYYAPLDQTGKRVDAQDRVELTYAAHEIVAPSDYMVRQPMPPVYLFCIDVSLNTQRNGSLHAISDSILSSLSQLPGDKRTLVGFITYDSSVHFYTFHAGVDQPIMHVITDVEGEMFLPTPSDLLINLDENRAAVETFLTNLPSMFTYTTDVESCVGSAMESAVLAMQRIGGRLSMFMSGLPSIGVGRLTNRENAKLLNTDKEHTLLQPSTDFYKKFSIKLTKAQIVCDMYFIATDYMDVSTVGETARFTGGEVYYYAGYTPELHATKLAAELHRSLVREQSWEAVIRVRPSKGISISNFHGNFFLRGTDLMAVPGTDSDKTFAFELRSEPMAGGADGQMQALNPSEPVIIQSALLYTNSNGERRIRVLTLAVPVATSPLQLYQQLNVNATINLIAKEAVQVAWQQGFERARDHIRNSCIALLRAAQNNVRREEQHLIQPLLSVVPTMTLGLLKSMAFRADTHEVIRTDMRGYHLMRLCTMSLLDTETLSRPRMIRIDETTLTGEVGTITQPSTSEQAQSVALRLQTISDPFSHPEIDYTTVVALPEELPLAADSVTENSVLLVDNGMEIMIRFGRRVTPTFLSAVFGLQSLDQLDSRHPPWQQLQPNDTTSLNARLHHIVAYLRATSAVSGLHQPVTVCKQDEPSDYKFFPYLINDRQGNALSIGEFHSLIYGQQQQQRY